MKIPTIMLASLGLLVAAPAASAACNLAIVPGADPTVTHDAFDALATQMSFSVQVTNTGDETCVSELFLVPIGGGLSLRNGPYVLAYAFRSPAGLTGGAELGPVSVVVPAASSKTITFDTEIPRSVATPGTYRGAVSLVLRRERLPVSERTINLTAKVSARAQMSVSGTRSRLLSAGPALIDLGILQDGDQGTAFVNVWANSSVRVKLSSENKGALRLTDAPSLPGIPYVVSFDGDQRSLTTPVELQRVPSMSSNGESYPLVVTVPRVGSPYAGTYRDIITVTVDNN